MARHLAEGKKLTRHPVFPSFEVKTFLIGLLAPMDLLTLTTSKQKTLSNVEVHQGDILLNITGDSVARACIVPSDVIPARVNQHVAILRPKEKANATFILAWLQTNKDLLLKLDSSGATRNALTKRMLEGLDINLPSIDIQNHIAELISLIQSKINLNIKLNGYLAA